MFSGSANKVLSSGHLKLLPDRRAISRICGSPQVYLVFAYNIDHPNYFSNEWNYNAGIRYSGVRIEVKLLTYLPTLVYSNDFLMWKEGLRQLIDV